MNGELVWSPFVWLLLPQLISLSELGLSIKCSPNLGGWQTEWPEALKLLCHTDNTSDDGPYRLSIESS